MTLGRAKNLLLISDASGCVRVYVCVYVTRESLERSIKKKRAVGSKFFIMCAKMAFQHQPGTAMECLSVRLKSPYHFVIRDTRNEYDTRYTYALHH